MMKPARHHDRGASASFGKRGSVVMRAVTLLLRMRGKPLANANNLREVVVSRTYPTPAAVPISMQKAYDIRHTHTCDRVVIKLSQKTNATTPWHILYLHGGAYVKEMVKPHWDIIRALSKAAGGAFVTVPLYPLAPEYNNRDAFAFLADVYREMLSHTPASNIIIAGDSAGGGLAIGLTIKLRQEGLEAPSRIIAFAPWLDLTLADERARQVEAIDVMLGVEALRMAGTWWAADDDVRAPHLSPLYADLATAGLPPIDIYQGASDLLVFDARTFAKKAQAALFPVTYHEYSGAFHVFVGATFTPEAKDAYARIHASLAAVANK